jgi:hypothetical protein
MEPFSVFDPGYAGDLVVEKKGMPFPVFTLTDGVKIYGALSYSGNGQRTIQTAQHTWKFGSGKSYPRDILIIDTLTGETTAVVKTSFWLARISIVFADGQTFKFIRATVFSKKPRWYNEQFGNVLSTECQLFSFKQTFKVIPEQSSFKNNDYLLIMAFFSVHLTLMRRVSAFGIAD